jgi:hypothetical protein
MIGYLGAEFFDLSQLNNDQAESFWQGIGNLLRNPISKDHLVRVIAARFHMLGNSAPRICVRPAKDKEVTSMDSNNHTMIINFNDFVYNDFKYVDYNPLCRMGKAQKIAREVAMPFHQTLSHELGHHFDYLTFINLDFFRQDTGMLCFLSSPTFINIFFPNAKYIPDLKKAAYEALFNPLLNSFIKTLTEAFLNNNQAEITEGAKSTFRSIAEITKDAELIFRHNFAEVSDDFVETNVFNDAKRDTKDVTTLDLSVNFFHTIPIDQEIKMRSDSLIEALFLQPLYRYFSNSQEILRIHGVKVINLSGKNYVIIDPCCDVTIAEFEGRNSRWTHLSQHGSTIPDKQIPEKSTIDQYAQKLFGNIASNAGQLIQASLDKIKSNISGNALKSSIMEDSIYKQVFKEFFDISLEIIQGKNIKQANETDNFKNVYGYYILLHSFVQEENLLYDLRK